MRYKSIILIAAAVLWPVGAIGGSGKPVLHIHLPRSVKVSGPGVLLGRIGIIRSSDEDLASKASNIAMGRTPWSKEKMVVDRRTILSRLASSGFKASDVRLTGAEKVVVTRREKIFPAKQLIEIAEAFVKKARPAGSECHWRLLRKPDDLLTPEAADIKLKPRMGAVLASGCVSVEVAAVSGGREIGVARVLFKQLYNVRQLKAIRNIPAGGIITSQNARVVVVSSPTRGSQWKSPFGMRCSRAVRAGASIPQNLWKATESVVVIRRNKTVQMKIRMSGFIIVANAQALEDGRVGETIKVRNTDSKRIVMAKVAFDGTVSPVYGNKR